jgi:hypothetical protein
MRLAPKLAIDALVRPHNGKARLQLFWNDDFDR